MTYDRTGSVTLGRRRARPQHRACYSEECNGRDCKHDQKRSGTNSESVRLIRGADGGAIAMRIEYLAAIAIVAAGTGLAVYSVGSLSPEKQPTPAAAQLATVLAESVDPFLHRSGG
jgi:hypothetical protein